MCATVLPLPQKLPGRINCRSEKNNLKKNLQHHPLRNVSPPGNVLYARLPVHPCLAVNVKLTFIKAHSWSSPGSPLSLMDKTPSHALKTDSQLEVRVLWSHQPLTKKLSCRQIIGSLISAICLLETRISKYNTVP